MRKTAAVCFALFFAFPLAAEKWHWEHDNELTEMFEDLAAYAYHRGNYAATRQAMEAVSEIEANMLAAEYEPFTSAEQLQRYKNTKFFSDEGDHMIFVSANTDDTSEGAQLALQFLKDWKLRTITAQEAFESITVDGHPFGQRKQEKTTSVQSQAFLKSGSRIFFVREYGNGGAVMAEAYRDLPENGLHQAIAALLAGPIPSETRAGITSLIPDGTRLLGAGISDGVATLDFSDEFTDKFSDVDGITAQLMQVVYTATEFDGVKGVQILINGKKEEYYNDVSWIGSPLSRNLFRSWK